jgi:amidase
MDPISTRHDLEPTSSAGQLADAVRSRRISSRELLEAYLARIERLNPTINAVVTLSPERAFEEADRADADTARGRFAGPLHGLPITVKDAIETAGIVSTGGAVELVGHVPKADAPAVDRLRRAGAIVFGKTNVPRWSGDIQTFNDLFGTTNNPWALDRTPGGSSGGAAAAVATGLTAFEIGTDIGGSIRTPSSFCGVFGHKPSFGVVSQRGYLDRVGGGIIDSDINVFGPIARSAEDLDLLLGVLAGPNREDATAWSIRWPEPRHGELSGYRIGTWLDDPACSVDGGCLEVMEAAAAELARAGAHVSVARPSVDLAESTRLFNALLIPAISPSVDDPAFGEAISGNHLQWLRAHQERARLRQVWAEWFRDYDALLCPTMPMAAFPHDHRGTINDRRVLINGAERNQVDTFSWAGLVGVAYLPATSVPVGRNADGLPVGLQIVGPYLEDRTPLFLAARLSEIVGGFAKPGAA